MKVRLLAIACAVLGLSFAMGSTAGAVVTINVRPYALSFISIGSTDPGDPASKLCLVTPDNPTTYGGLINNAPGGAAGDLNIHLFEQDTVTQVATCVPTSIAVTTVDPVGTAGTQAIDNAPPKTGGTLQIATAASVQPGISATSATTIDVHLSAAQVVALPAGSVQIACGTCLGVGTLTGPGIVRMILKTTAVATKAQLDTAACSDKQYFIDALDADGSTSNGPTAIDATDPVVSRSFTDGSRTGNVVTLTGSSEVGGLTVGDSIVVDAADNTYDGTRTITSVTENSATATPFNGSITYAQTAANDVSAGATTAAHTYAIGESGTYLASIRNCAEMNVSVPGKAVTTKIKVTGNGASSVDFVKAATINPRVWDTTRGASCSAVKTAGTFGDVKQSSRVLSCKGDYGVPIPLALDVRGWVASGSGTGVGQYCNPQSGAVTPCQDPYGVLHPSPPTQILSGTFS